MRPKPSAPTALRPYQSSACDFLLASSTAMLAADPGLGKTRVSLEAARAAEAKRVLVVCPAVARVSWQSEVSKWGWPAAGAVVCDDPRELSATCPGVYVVTYGQLARPRWRAVLRNLRWDVLICDEAHRLKERSTACTKAIYGARCDGKGGVAGTAERVWLLTGTPAPNNYGEVWTHLHALAPTRIHTASGKPMDHRRFVEHVCVLRETPFGAQVVGSKNAPWLKERLSGWMLRQRKAEVAKDLPALDFMDVPVALDHDVYLRELALAMDDMAAANGGQVPMPETPDLDAMDDDAFVTAAARDPHVATVRRALGRAKAGPAAEWITEFLSGSDKKIIVFALHRDVMDRLEKALVKFGVARVDGATSTQGRTDAVDAFQGKDGPRVFLGQIMAAGTAITLTNASDVVMVEMAWTPADNFQAACRAHRLGQKDGVMVRVLNAPDTLDERVARVLRQKTQDIAAVFGT